MCSWQSFILDGFQHLTLQLLNSPEQNAGRLVRDFYSRNICCNAIVQLLLFAFVTATSLLLPNTKVRFENLLTVTVVTFM